MGDTERDRQTKEKEIERKIETETERKRTRQKRESGSFTMVICCFYCWPNDHRETPNLHVYMYVYAQFNAIFEC